jgi:hypothetical protein
MYFFTPAPKVLDLASTREIEPRVGTTGIEKVRLIDVEKSCVGMQRTLYNTNLYVMLTQEDFVKVIDAKLVVLLEPTYFVRTYTDALACYDWAMYTIELHPHIAETRRKHDPVRLVLLRKEGGGEAMQVGRYASGLHMALTHEHFYEQLSNEQYGIVVPVQTAQSTITEEDEGDSL